MAAQTDRRLVAVMFTDIEGYSAITQKDEGQALSFVSRYRRAVSESTQRYHGEVVHFYGDGSLTLYDSAIKAVHCAIEIQSQLQQETIVPVRIGIHLGEIVRQGDTIYGNAVNIASRLQHLGTPGSVLVSDAVVEQFINQSEPVLQYIGVEAVKNIEEPVKVYAVQAEGLVVPSWSEISRRNRSASRTPAFIPWLVIIAVAAIGAFQLFSNGNPLDDDILDDRIVVLPFENNTGDSTLSFIGQMASRHISKCLEETDRAYIVDYDRFLRADHGQQFSILPRQRVIELAQAKNFIDGSFALRGDSLILIESSLRKGATLELIKSFPSVTVSRHEVSQGIDELGQRIAGYWLSKGELTVSIPTQDAYKAFIEATRHWHKDYARAIYFLRRSIEIDTTFLDAYYLLFDAHANQGNYREAEKVLDTIDLRFDLEKFSDVQQTIYQFYEAQINCKNLQTYRHAKELYNEDPAEFFVNTDMAVKALEFVNEPEECLKILEVIPFDSVDFEINAYGRDRISLAVKACFMTGQYARAAEYAQFYPRDDMKTTRLRLQARALAGIRDTAAISDLLRRLRVTDNTLEMSRVLYQLSRDFRLLGESSLAQHYTQEAFRVFEKNHPVHGHFLYDLGDTEAGMEFFLQARKDYGDLRVVLFGLARGSALMNDAEKAITYIKLMNDIKPERFDFGKTEYDQARIFTFIGAYDEAIIKLDQAIDNGLFFTLEKVENDPDLMPLFNHPEFEKVIHPARN